MTLETQYRQYINMSTNPKHAHWTYDEWYKWHGEQLKNVIMNILTAEESFLQTTGYHMNHKDIKQAMIEFAKLHVKAALEAASNSTDIYDFQEEIKNAYPLTNIK